MFCTEKGIRISNGNEISGSSCSSSNSSSSGSSSSSSMTAMMMMMLMILVMRIFTRPQPSFSLSKLFTRIIYVITCKLKQ